MADRSATSIETLILVVLLGEWIVAFAAKI